SCRRTRRGATSWSNWCVSTRRGARLPLDERLQFLEEEVEHLVLGEVGDRSSGDWPLSFDDAPASRAADVAEHDGRVARRVTRQLDVIFRNAFRRQPHTSPRRKHAERITARLERAR